MEHLTFWGLPAIPCNWACIFVLRCAELAKGNLGSQQPMLFQQFPICFSHQLPPIWDEMMRHLCSYHAALHHVTLHLSSAFFKLPWHVTWAAHAMAVIRITCSQFGEPIEARGVQYGLLLVLYLSQCIADGRWGGGKQEHMAQGYLRVFHGLAVLCSPKLVDTQVSCLVNTFELQCAFYHLSYCL